MSTKPLQSGDRLGNYLLREVVGKGAFAQVWKAVHHERPGRVVALKVATDPAFRRQLSREGGLPDIKHPNVVPILDCDTRFADHPYVVMPFYASGNLADLIARHPHGLPEDRVEALLKDILSGLSAAHQQGVVHRDIKPANILLDEHGRALVADFGLSLHEALPEGVPSLVQSMSLSTEGNGALAGTLAYMAPEVLNGTAGTKASDVYSVAFLFFEMLTGRRPAGLELPSQVRTDLRRRAHFDGLFYWACRPVAERYPDAAAMARAAEEAPEKIPWADQRTEAIASAMATHKPANESLKPRSSDPYHCAHLKQQGRFHRPLISIVVLSLALALLGMWSIANWVNDRGALSSSPTSKTGAAGTREPSSRVGSKTIIARPKPFGLDRFTPHLVIPFYHDYWWSLKGGCVRIENALGESIDSCPGEKPSGKLSESNGELAVWSLNGNEVIVTFGWKPY